MQIVIFFLYSEIGTIILASLVKMTSAHPPPITLTSGLSTVYEIMH